MLGAFGINLKAPLKDQIQEAIASPEAFAKRKASMAGAFKAGPQQGGGGTETVSGRI